MKDSMFLNVLIAIALPLAMSFTWFSVDHLDLVGLIILFIMYGFIAMLIVVRNGARELENEREENAEIEALQEMELDKYSVYPEDFPIIENHYETLRK